MQEAGAGFGGLGAGGARFIIQLFVRLDGFEQVLDAAPHGLVGGRDFGLVEPEFGDEQNFAAGGGGHGFHHRHRDFLQPDEGLDGGGDICAGVGVAKNWRGSDAQGLQDFERDGVAREFAQLVIEGLPEGVRQAAVALQAQAADEAGEGIWPIWGAHQHELALAFVIGVQHERGGDVGTASGENFHLGAIEQREEAIEGGLTQPDEVFAKILGQRRGLSERSGPAGLHDNYSIRHPRKGGNGGFGWAWGACGDGRCAPYGGYGCVYIYDFGAGGGPFGAAAGDDSPGLGPAGVRDFDRGAAP